MIQRNARGLAQLVDDLLDVARIERGSLSLRPERLDLGEVLASLATLFAPEAGARGVALEIDGGGAEPVFVDGDRLRLEQAFGDLIANALKFTPAGGRVGVRLEREGARARVRVRDTGQGIAPELLPHVFERYRQGEGGPQGPGRGLGLGLAIVQQVVALHGGSIEVESEGEGLGTTFTVCVPLSGPADGR
ncbi:MAG TPA: HAMP domain-containing sensor histidine kinase [Polyangiaceae bacterium]|nr:HAMP domain-containing sensor histidine kinase [Polyangiaceae bacterium]